MTAHILNRRMRRAARAQQRLAGVRAYVDANRAEVSRVMRIAAGEAGAAEAESLFLQLSRPRPDDEAIFDRIGRMRDDLADAEAGVGGEHLDARSDLDAAIRLHGARLDELLNATGS